MTGLRGKVSDLASGNASNRALQALGAYDAKAEDILEQVPEVDGESRENIQGQQKLRRQLDRALLKSPRGTNEMNRRKHTTHEEEERRSQIRGNSAQDFFQRENRFWGDIGYHSRLLGRDRHQNETLSEKKLRKLSKRNEELGTVAERYALTINANPARHIMLLQYPDRDDGQLYCNAFGQKPLEIRIKPKCGLVEVDIPLGVNKSYNIRKGRKFGSALHNSDFFKKRDPLVLGSRSFRNSQVGLSHLSGDVEMTDAPSEAEELSDAGGRSSNDDASDLEDKIEHGRRPTAKPSSDTARHSNMNGRSGGDGFSDEERSGEDPYQESDDALGEGYLMDKFTLGGRIMPFKDGDPIYMVATFEEGTCTWTKVDAIVSLRAQFAHLDAVRMQDKPQSQAHQDEVEKLKEGKASREVRAQDVNLRVKDTGDPESAELHYGGIPATMKFLREMADEPWQSLEWIDQDVRDTATWKCLKANINKDTRAYQSFDQALIRQGNGADAQLISTMTHEQYLDAISCPKVDPARQGQKIMQSLESDFDSSQNGESGVESDSEREEGGLSGEDDEGAAGNSLDAEDEHHPDGFSTDARGKNILWKGGLAYGWRPKGKPDDRQSEVQIERVCRIICLEEPNKHEHYLKWLYETKGKDPEFLFLNPTHYAHHYFLWRLSENRSGRGIMPEYDIPLKEVQAQARRGGKKSDRRAGRGKRR